MSEAAVDFDFDQDGRLNGNACGNDLQPHRVGGPERPESLVAKCAQGVVDVSGHHHQAKSLIKDPPACEPKRVSTARADRLFELGRPGGTPTSLSTCFCQLIVLG